MQVRYGKFSVQFNEARPFSHHVVGDDVLVSRLKSVCRQA